MLVLLIISQVSTDFYNKPFLHEIISIIRVTRSRVGLRLPPYLLILWAEGFLLSLSFFLCISFSFARSQRVVTCRKAISKVQLPHLVKTSYLRIQAVCFPTGSASKLFRHPRQARFLSRINVLDHTVHKTRITSVGTSEIWNQFSLI